MASTYLSPEFTTTPDTVHPVNDESHRTQYFHDAWEMALVRKYTLICVVFTVIWVRASSRRSWAASSGPPARPSRPRKAIPNRYPSCR